jgi:hypothetical protein
VPLLVVPACSVLTTVPAPIAAVAVTLSFGLPAAVWMALHASTVGEFRAHAAAALGFGAQASVTLLGFGGLFAFSVYLGGAAAAAYAATVVVSRHSGRTVHAVQAATPEETETRPDDMASIAERLHAVDITVEQARGMSDTDLCRAWRRSFVTLEHTRGVHRRAQVVALRQMLLDELETRYPAGLRAWLASGARAAGGPDRYLGASGPGGGSPEAA